MTQRVCPYRKIKGKDGIWSFPPMPLDGMLFWGITEYVILDKKSGRHAFATPASFAKHIPEDKLKELVSKVELVGHYEDSLYEVRISKQDTGR